MATSLRSFVWREQRRFNHATDVNAGVLKDSAERELPPDEFRAALKQFKLVYRPPWEAEAYWDDVLNAYYESEAMADD